MGWWKETVYGGQPATEWRENIYEHCGADEFTEQGDFQPVPREILQEKIDSIRSLIDGAETDEDDRNIGYQVLGAILMHAGFDIDTGGLKERIIQAIEEDKWSIKNPVRLNVMKNYKKLVNEYDLSAPFDVETVNMFEENEDEEEEIVKEFKAVFTLLNGRKKRLTKRIEEKSGNNEFDEGFEAAAAEELDFLDELKELLSRQEMLGIILERIEKGLIDSNPLSNKHSEPVAKASVNSSGSFSSGSSGGNDVMPG